MKYLYTKPKQPITKVLFTDGDRVYFNEKGNTQQLRIGVGDKEHISCRLLRLRLRKAIRMAKEHDLTSLLFNVQDIECTELNCNKELGRLFAENIGKANYDYTTYKTKSSHKKNIEKIYLEGANTQFKEGVKIGVVVAKYINICRDLSNAPAGDMTPLKLANQARELAKDLPIRVSVLNKDDAESLGMGLLLAVDKGATEHLKFIVMEYFGDNHSEKPLVFVGKGVTFDTGGINLKASSGGGLESMKHDMTGGAVVIASILAAAALKLKKNIVTLVPAVENGISGNAYRPGDVLTAMNGTTVEVLNTDAEGRLILADALTYAERYHPALVVDVATLTGASLVTIGHSASIVMTKDKDLENKVCKLSEIAGDYVWPLPLWDEYKDDIKSHIADIANLATTAVPRNGGCIHAGTFLSYFAENFPWVHLDIAPRMMSCPADNLARGATGEPVRLLIRLAEED